MHVNVFTIFVGEFSTRIYEKYYLWVSAGAIRNILHYKLFGDVKFHYASKYNSKILQSLAKNIVIDIYF